VEREGDFMFGDEVLIVSQCPGAITNPVLDKFANDVGANMWHHIAVPPMSTEEFYTIINQVHTFIQELLDKREPTQP